MKKKFQDMELGEVFTFKSCGYFVKSGEESFYTLDTKNKYILRNVMGPGYEYEVVGKMQLVGPDEEVVKKPKKYIKDLAPFDVFKFEHSEKEFVHVNKNYCLPYGEYGGFLGYTYEEYNQPVTIIGKMERKDGSIKKLGELERFDVFTINGDGPFLHLNRAFFFNGGIVERYEDFPQYFVNGVEVIGRMEFCEPNKEQAMCRFCCDVKEDSDGPN